MKLKSFLKIYFIALAALLIIINACSVNKRVYRSGYNIEWNASRKSTSKRDLSNNLYINKTPQVEIADPLEDPITASNSISTISSKVLFLSERSVSAKPDLYTKGKVSKYIEGCDTIVFKNGLKIKAKVLEIGAQEIKYKMCDNQDGPTFIKNTADVSFISHANGTFTEVSGSTGGLFNTQNTIENTNQKPNPAPANTSSSGTSGKSQLIAALLCGFIGFLGIHRFYLGYTGLGILMLFTLGCCGILALVDFIRIIIGDLKPKDGDYTEKF